MSKLIKGIHHVSMKTCNDEEYKKAYTFYKNVLELEVIEEWDNLILFDTGSGVVEIFRDGTEHLEKGVIRHFAFDVDNVDACIEKVKAAGYKVFVEPKDVCLGGDEKYSARVAFCKGPLGEEIEFFCQRW